ncbi:MAG: hypothetical protein GXY64_02315 [Bacteroidales bacterium]|nr:hypothetical protein [Bacteroidales bacterium]
MSISVRLNKAETEIIKKYAEFKGMTVSDLVRQSVLERIEDEHDLATYHKAMAASSVVVLPMILLFLFARKQIIRGVARGGIKG